MQNYPAEFMKQSDCPSWVVYPELYLKLIKEGNHKFLPWLLYEKHNQLIRIAGLKIRYPKRRLFPFARRDCHDDIACWEKDKPGQVFIIHDFASPGWEQRQLFDSFEDWYKFALTQTYDS